jgi:hypothetical protein
MGSRWDRLLDTKPVPLLDHLVDAAGRLLAAELRRWPLPVQEVDARASAELEPLLAPDSPRPGTPVFGEALRLVRWDLAREHEAYDDYVRNRRYLERGVAESDRPALLFISRWVLEQLLALAEATGGRLNRGALARVVDGIDRDLRAPGPSA